METIRNFAYEHRWVLALFAVLMVFAAIGMTGAETADASWHIDPVWTAHDNGICETHGTQIYSWAGGMWKHTSTAAGFYESVAQWEWVTTSAHSGYWKFRGSWTNWGC